MDLAESNLKSGHKLPLEECIMQVLQQLGIEQAHFAGCSFDDLQGLAIKYPEVISSLALICPFELRIDLLQKMSSRVFLVMGENSLDTETLSRALTTLSETTFITLDNFRGETWDDAIAARKDEIKPALIEFINKANQEQGVDSVSLVEKVNEIAGVSFAVQGAGPPLVLLPLELAPSQWQPIISELSEQYCTITLTGPKLGIIPFLEERGHSAGYQRMLRAMLDIMQLQAGQSILEVGCGSGVVNRWLAHQMGGLSRIVGVDINGYLLQEAATLAQKEELDQIIEFRQGNAENLPFSDDVFDGVISATVLEEVDADKALKEMIRVTRPGGRVGSIVRAKDRPWLFNLPLSATLKSKMEAPLESFNEGKGCASASLYNCFQRSRLTNITMMPYLAVFDDPEGGLEEIMEASFLSRLSPDEVTEWQTGKVMATSERTYFFAWPHHCAVGTKPGQA